MTITAGSEVLDRPTPTLFEHCVTVYKEMEAQARDEGDDGLIYEGHTTKLFNQLGLSAPYYTAVLTRLKRMNCVIQLRRGGGSATSRWRLVNMPEEDSFLSFEKTNVARSGKWAATEQNVRSAHRRIDELTEMLNTLAEMVEELNARDA